MVTTNVIFVDIDGVLLSLKDCRSPENAALLRSRPPGFMQRLRFNAEAVKLLVCLADLAEAKLVLSSNWRRTWGPDSDALMEKLVSEGLRLDLWHEHWFVPLFGYEPRKFDELADWLDDYAPERALIIDDEKYRGPPLLAGAAAILEIDENDGYTLADHKMAFGFFGIEIEEEEEEDGKPPIDPPSGPTLRPEPDAPVNRPLRPYSPM